MSQLPTETAHFILSNKIIRWIRSSPICVDYDVEDMGSILSILVITEKQEELRVNIRNTLFHKKPVISLSIRNIANFDSVTRAYIKVIECDKFKVLRLKKGKNKYPSLLFIRSFERDIFYSYLFGLLNKR